MFTHPPLRYVEAPDEPEGGDLTLFLAGGISGTPDWQKDAVALLAAEPITVLNPRRAEFGINDDQAHAAQVAWEHRHLHEPRSRATAVLMWFPACPPQITQPIAWYELGRLIERGTPIAIGADPGYPRRRDVIVQMRLAAPQLVVHHTLTATVTAARRLLLDQQLMNICTDLALRLGPALNLHAGQWFEDPAPIVAGLQRACAGRFDELDARLDVPLHQLRQTLTDLAATPPGPWTPVQLVNTEHAIGQFTATAGAVGGFDLAAPTGGHE
jgi:hypothetical protein